MYGSYFICILFKKYDKMQEDREAILHTSGS